MLFDHPLDLLSRHCASPRRDDAVHSGGAAGEDTRDVRGKRRTALDAANTPDTAIGTRCWTGRQGWWVLAAAACLGLNGCATSWWEEVSSRDFNINKVFEKSPDPLWTINNSQDGDKRARAFGALQEPLAHGGTQKDQDAVVTVLVYAAANDQQPLCRIRAIGSLSEFKDPRAVEGLKEAYYRANSFPPEMATTIRVEALRALGETHSPSAIDMLVKVLNEPKVEGAEVERLQSLDVRSAAARALGHFRTKESTDALLAILRSEQEPLHVPAYDALVLATGRHLPPDPAVWDDLLQKAPKNGSEIVVEPTFQDRLTEIVPASFSFWK
jgi:HEAT repeats